MTGPNHLHIVDAAAVPVVLGAKYFEKAERKAWNSILLPVLPSFLQTSFFAGYQVIVPIGGHGALGTMINCHDHQSRRRLWDRAMNSEAMQGYRDIFSKRINQFIGMLEKKDGQIIDLSLYSSLLAYVFFFSSNFYLSFKLIYFSPSLDLTSWEI